MADVAVESAGENQAPTIKTAGTDATTPSTSHVIRELGLPAVFVFAIAGIGLTYSGAFAFSSAAGVFPGASLFGMLTVAILVGLVFAYLYAAMGAIAPRYGADYVISSRVLPPALAFASSFTLFVFFSTVAGAMVSSIAQRTIPVFARTLTLLNPVQSIDVTVTWASTPNGIVTLGTLGVLIIFLLLILPPRVTYQVLLASLALAVLAWLVISLQVGAAAGSFPAAWDKLMGPGSFADVLTRGASAGMQADSGLGRTLLAGLALSFWFISGYSSPVLMAREIKRPEKNLLRGIWLALLAAWFVLGAATLVVQNVVGQEWLSAQSYLYATGGQATPWVMLYAAAASPSLFLAGLAGILWVFTILTMAQVMMYAASREVVAWAKDRIAPQLVAYIHPVLRSPLIAVLLVAMCAELGVVDTALNGALFTRYHVLFFLAVIQIVPVLSMALLPYRRYALYRSGPDFARLKIGPLPLLTLIGGLAVVYLVAVVVLNAALRIFGGIGAPTLLVFTVLFGGGFGIYYLRRYLLRSNGEDIPEIRWENLPEE